MSAGVGGYPRLPDIPRALPFRVEMWDRWNDSIRWVISASTSVATAGPAFQEAVAHCAKGRVLFASTSLDHLSNYQTSHMRAANWRSSRPLTSP